MVVLVFRPIPKFYDRFARQNRYGPPSEFPLTSPYSGIVHHLSGPNIYALPPNLQSKTNRLGVLMPPPKIEDSQPKHFHCAFRVSITLILAYILDSLVRVSRRVP